MLRTLYLLFQKQAPSPQAAPLQKEATKTEIKATKDDKEVASTPKTAKAPVKRKLIETVAAVAAPDAKPTEVDKEKLKCKHSGCFPLEEKKNEISRD